MRVYWDIFYAFLKIGAFTLGGGYAMVPLIEREVVDSKKWISRHEFIDLLAIAQAVPGVLAVNMAVFAGYKVRGVKGSVVAALGATLPSFVIILAIAIFFTGFKDNPVVERIFKGIRPAVVALIAVPVITTAKAAGITYKTVVIPIVVALLIWLLSVSPVYVVAAAAAGGLIYQLGFKDKKTGRFRKGESEA
ncbi:MAG: chromate transporter [Prevotellaceae bacterium]|jgi:chromate transporter|nr:chromate transporter [Prevotellaceae bacterium]